jgi:cell division protein FtsL
MNAAARLFSQNSLSRGWAISLLWTRAQVSSLLLMLAVLTTALGIVYFTNVSRSLNANLQQVMVERDHVHAQLNQLLLEKSTWMMPARVQQMAEDEFGMITPDDQSIVVFDAKKRV